MMELLTLEEVFCTDDVEKAGGICSCWGREEVWPELL